MNALMQVVVHQYINGTQESLHYTLPQHNAATEHGGAVQQSHIKGSNISELIRQKQESFHRVDKVLFTLSMMASFLCHSHIGIKIVLYTEKSANT